jgi:hypothetical protein
MYPEEIKPMTASIADGQKKEETIMIIEEAKSELRAIRSKLSLILQPPIDSSTDKPAATTTLQAGLLSLLEDIRELKREIYL